MGGSNGGNNRAKNYSNNDGRKKAQKMTTRKYNKNCAAQNTNNGNTINKKKF